MDNLNIYYMHIQIIGLVVDIFTTDHFQDVSIDSQTSYITYMYFDNFFPILKSQLNHCKHNEKIPIYYDIAIQKLFQVHSLLCKKWRFGTVASLNLKMVYCTI